MKRLILSLGLLALAAVLAACSGGPWRDRQPGGVRPGRLRPGRVRPGGRRDRRGRQGPQVLDGVDHGARRRSVPDRLDNQEVAPHNVAIKDASGAEKFKGEIFTSTQITYDVPALAAGTYDFRCEVHPGHEGHARRRVTTASLTAAPDPGCCTGRGPRYAGGTARRPAGWPTPGR